MSIFKETFPEYVENQLRIREAILAQRKDGETNFSQARTESPTAKLKDNSKLKLPAGSFYNNTVVKQCIIISIYYKYTLRCIITMANKKELQVMKVCIRSMYCNTYKITPDINIPYKDITV